MVRTRLVAALAAVLLCLLPAAADARSQTFRVYVTEAGTGQRAVGSKVELSDMQGNKLGSGVVDAQGTATITVELADDSNKVLITVDAKDAGGRSGFVVFGPFAADPKGLSVGMETNASRAFASELMELAKAAIAKCDKAAYDRWVGELDRRIADLERGLKYEQQAADSYPREQGLRATDLAGALKDLERAAKAQQKLDPSLRNPNALQALQTYVSLLTEVKTSKSALDEARRARESVPSFPEDCKKDKFGLVPGQKTCSDGSGGLLAGALNDLFDSDLDPVCDDPSRRRDTDRAKKERREREDRRRD